MKAGINIEARLAKGHAEAVAQAIATIFESGFENHVDQATLEVALQTFQALTKVENITVSNCHIGNK